MLCSSWIFCFWRQTCLQTLETWNLLPAGIHGVTFWCYCLAVVLDKPYSEGPSLEGIEHIYETGHPKHVSLRLSIIPIYPYAMDATKDINIGYHILSWIQQYSRNKQSFKVVSSVCCGWNLRYNDLQGHCFSVYHNKMRTSGESYSFDSTSFFCRGVLSVSVCSLNFTWDIHMLLLMV